MGKLLTLLGILVGIYAYFFYTVSTDMGNGMVVINADQADQQKSMFMLSLGLLIVGLLTRKRD
ncbi:MAG: hypothetical protein V4649_08045 [Bacteroidota bacterium]